MTRLSGETALGLAWIIALTASLAVLFIGEVLGQTPCVLCWFQRAFILPVVLARSSKATPRRISPISITATGR